jgi:coenzyme A diphosphatase NUDT7
MYLFRTVLPHSRAHPQPVLNAAEVHSLFAHPLRAFLSPDAPRAPDFVDRMPELPVDDDAAAAEHAAYHSARDERWAGDPSGKRRVRVHVFTTGREAEGTKPVFGLTA